MAQIPHGGPARGVERAEVQGRRGWQAIIPDGDGWAVAAGVAELETLSSWCLGKLGESLPGGTYRLVPAARVQRARLCRMGAGAISLDRYRKDGKAKRRASC
jgi:leucyl aminopeptidase